METLDVIAKGTSQSIKEIIKEQLQKQRDPKKQLSTALHYLSTAVELEEQVGEIAAESWSYIQGNRLWEASGYASLDALKEDIYFDHILKATIERSKTVADRKGREILGILQHWHCHPQDVLPSDLIPPYFSDNLLKNINRMSKLNPWETAIPLLVAIVQKRLGTNILSAPYLSPTDVLSAIRAIETSKKAKQVPNTSDPAVPEVGDTLSKGQTLERERTSSRPMNLDISDTRPPPEHASGPTLDEPCSETQYRVTRSVIRLKRTAYEFNEDDENNDNKNDDDDDDNDDDDGDQAGQETAPPRLSRKKPRLDDCSCSVGARKAVDSFVVSAEVSHQGVALASLRQVAPFQSLCRNHLRLFAGNALDMVTNITTAALLERLEWIYPRKLKMVDVRRVRPSWFRGQSGDVWRETPPVFVKGEREDFHFDAAQVFDRFAGEGSWERWLRDGTLILPDIFCHLQRVKLEIHSEFDMYAFHLGKQPGLPTMGWMRNMYHSGPQQLMYQDPILWALTAAARADKHWRLIAYPYNAKNAAAGQKTGFLHLDLDLKRHQSEGLGKNMVQSSVSLTDENGKGCTLVVPGFHKRFQEWVRTKWDTIESRASRRSTTDMKGMYTAEDRVRFGKPIPAPCPAWGIRLSRSDIIHGSSDEGTQLRRVMSPWFTAINDDHKSMENPDCMNWEELSSCHKDLTGPTKESLGDHPRKGIAGVRFPGAIPVRSAYSLPQALVGLKEWTEPDVIFERNILLGPDDNQAFELARNIRKQLVDTYKLLHPLMKVRERNAFGHNSSFAENNVAQSGDGDEDIELDEDSE